ncbi:hypothetical protein ACV35T_33935, partial [Pseudomonas aeruginosa]
PERKLPLPPKIVEKSIDTLTGLLSPNGGRKEYFIVGTEPTRTYLSEMQERGYYVPTELQQRLNNEGNTPATQPQELF